MNYWPQLASSGATRGTEQSALWWIGKVCVVGLLVAWLYAPIMWGLVRQWIDDPNYSHGFLVPAFSLFLFLQRRADVANAKSKPSNWGVSVVALGVGLLVVGTLGAELFLSRISALVVIAGLIVFLVGWNTFRLVFTPWIFLILMIPIPSIVLSRVTFPLQQFTSSVSAALLPLFGVPVLREGNIINLPALPLEVAEACSGIRSLLSLLTLSIMYGYLTDKRPWVRFVLALASVPLAVIANSARIVFTGLLAQYWGADKAEGFFHGFSGWLIFLMSLALLTAVHRLVRPAEVQRLGS